MPKEQFSTISLQVKVVFRSDNDDDVCFILDLQA